MSGAADPTTGPWRVARGLAVGATSTALALGGHVLGGGHASLPAVTVLAAATITLSVLWSGRRWTTGALLSVLVALQAVGHVAFASSGPMPAGSMTMTGAHDASGMLAGHLLAALLTAALLRRGEHWCWRLAELASGHLRALRLLAGVATPARAPRGAARSSYVVPAPASVGRAHPRRGPPALAAG